MNVSILSWRNIKETPLSATAMTSNVVSGVYARVSTCVNTVCTSPMNTLKIVDCIHSKGCRLSEPPAPVLAAVVVVPLAGVVVAPAAAAVAAPSVVETLSP